MCTAVQTKYAPAKMSKDIPRVIALCGGMRSGKDTVADCLRERYGYFRVAFGDALRVVVSTMYPEAFTNREQYRRRMQDIGQHMRAYDPDVWVRPARRMVEDYTKRGHPVVVTDMRQPNEYAAMREIGALVVRVDCPVGIRRVRAGTEAAYMEHETEGHFPMFDVDHVLDNSRDFTHLYRQVDRLMAGVD